MFVLQTLPMKAPSAETPWGLILMPSEPSPVGQGKSLRPEELVFEWGQTQARPSSTTL